MYRSNIYYLIVFFFVLLTYFFQSSENSYSNIQNHVGKIIRKITFIGNQHVSNYELTKLIPIDIGVRVSYSVINDTLKGLFVNTSFSYAEIQTEDYKDGVTIIIRVVERPVISKITFVGLKEFNKDDTEEEIFIKEKEIFKKSDLIDSVNLLIAKYIQSGFHAISIKYRTKDDTDANTKEIIIIVDEGEEIRITKINIEGAKQLDPLDIQSALELDEDRLFTSGKFSEHLFEKDKQNIINYYQSQGFLNVKLLKASWNIQWKNSKRDKRVIVINFKISEGEQFLFSGYQIEWDPNEIYNETKTPVFTLSKLQKVFNYRFKDMGKILNNTYVEQDKGVISYLYSQKGHIYSQIIPQKIIFQLTSKEIKRLESSKTQKEYQKKYNQNFFHTNNLKKTLQENPELQGKQMVHFHFIIREGEKGYVENIIIKGNSKTNNLVIERELLVKEGDLFDATRIQKSREKIFNLGFFKSVNIDARPGTTYKQLNLIVEVEEQPTGTINLGGGYGTISGFSIFVDISEKNLFGAGKTISGKVEYGPQRGIFQVSYQEPWIFNQPIFWTNSIYVQRLERSVDAFTIFGNTSQQEESSYDTTTIGISTGVARQFAVYWQHYHQISPSFSLRSNPSSLVPDSIFLLAAQGWEFQNRFINGLIFDNRDNVFNTTFGLKLDLSINTIGNFLGGRDHYMQYSGSLTFYWWPLDYTFFGIIRKHSLRRWRVVFEHRISATFTHELSPLYSNQDKQDNLYIERENRLEIGGYETLRGWQIYDTYFPFSWRQYGGSHRILYGIELRIPLEPSLLWLVAFFEAGALYVNRNELALSQVSSQALIDEIDENRLNLKNLAPAYFRYSWGVGIRIQLPILPLRIYLAQRLEWNSTQQRLVPIPSNNDFEFVFGIGDKRF